MKLTVYTEGKRHVFTIASAYMISDILKLVHDPILWYSSIRDDGVEEICGAYPKDDLIKK